MTTAGELVAALPTESADAVFVGDSEMAARCRDFDWTQTPLGAVSTWSQSLRATVRLVLASGNPMLVFWGPELTVIYNDAFRPSFGEDGRHPGVLGAPAKECWKDVWHLVGSELEGVMKTGRATWHEDQLVPIARNGRLEDVWWTYSYSPAFDDDGSVAGTLVVCLETTRRVVSDRDREKLLAELQLERARLAEVFRQAPTFLAVLRGPDYVFSLANDAYFDIVGRRDIVGKPLLEALPEIRDQGFVAVLDRVVETGEPFVGREVRIVLDRAPGAAQEERFVDFVYQPLVEADGTRAGVIAHGSDVTDQVRARREIERLLVDSERARGEAEEARAEAEAANRAKSEFLAVMSHELRTPLNAIGGYADIIEMGIRGPVTPAQRDDLHRIQMSQRHLLGLINEVLNYAKLETGAVQYDLEKVLLRDVLLAAESLVAPQARAKGIRLVTHGCAEGLTVVADTEKLRQVLVNLLSNAVKFTDAGRIELECVAEGANVELRVSDTGIGIPRDKLESIFDPFVQVRADLTRTREGTGLGLAISRDLARGMGGDLLVESVLGGGSTFTLVLPALAA